MTSTDYHAVYLPDCLSWTVPSIFHVEVEQRSCGTFQQLFLTEWWKVGRSLSGTYKITNKQ